MTPTEKQKIIDEMVQKVKKHDPQSTDEQAKETVMHWVQILDNEINEGKRENNSQFFKKLQEYNPEEGRLFAKSIENWWDKLLDGPGYYKQQLSFKTRLKTPKSLDGAKDPGYVILTNSGIRTNKEMKKIMKIKEKLPGNSQLRLALSNIYNTYFLN